MYNNGAPNYYTFNAPRPQARNTQPLTAEQIARLRQNPVAFDMKVEPDDLLKASCTHKEKNGNSTLIQNTDGTVTCSICHETFTIRDLDNDSVKKTVTEFIDLLQTAKTLYLDASETLISQFFQMIPLLKKFPELYKRAIDNFNMYDNSQYSGVTPMNNPGFGSTFTALGNLLSNPYGGYYQQQPMYGQYQYQQPVPQAQPQAPYYQQAPQAQPYYQQQPVAQPAYYQQPMDPNPLAYGVPQGIPTPTAPAPGTIPPAQPQQPVAPAPQTAEVQQQKTFNV